MTENIKLRARRVFESMARAYLETAWLQASVDGLSSLIALVAVDALLGFPSALQVAFIIPIYFACLRGSRFGEILMVLTVVFVSANLEALATQSRAETSPIALILRTIVFGGLAQSIHIILVRLNSAYHKATHDELTGCHNRLALETSLHDAVKRHHLTGESLTIAMIDCDRFKALNDTHGHEYGDKILKTLVKQLERTMPTNTMVGRYGGDEFGIIFRNKSRAIAEAYLDKAAERFKDATFAMGTRTEISYGIAVAGEDGLDAASLARAADQNMYCKKTLKGMVDQQAMAAVRTA